MGPWLFTGGRPQDEQPHWIRCRQCLLVLCFIEGVWPPYAFAVPPPLCGSHPVAQLRAACWLRPACTAQQRALWVSHSIFLYWRDHTYVFASNFISICPPLTETNNPISCPQAGKKPEWCVILSLFHTFQGWTHIYLQQMCVDINGFCRRFFIFLYIQCS